MKLNYKSIIIASLLICSSISTFSQISNPVQTSAAAANTMPQGRTCGTGILPHQFEDWVQSLIPKGNMAKGGNDNSTESIFTIPVIVHVVHNAEALNSIAATSGGNLNAAQIIDQINILNKDFNGTNADTLVPSNIPAVFKPAFGRCKINFCLAVVNPTGGVLPEPGIDRINRVTKGWTAPPYSMAYCDATIKPNSIWDPSRYCNIWVLQLGSSLLGYATFPNPGATGLQGLSAPYGSPTTDGVVILNTAFGSIGTGQFAPYNKGRTTTHELGHWAGLRHVWGDANCGDDYCNDTPTQSALNFGCPSFPQVSCSNGPNGNMFMNYMDYVDDGCMHMFTKDQAYRTQLIMANSVLRASLLTSTVCNLNSVNNDIGLTNIVSPTYSQVVNCNPFINPVVQLSNLGVNLITVATLTYNVDGVGTQTLAWAGNLLPNTSQTVAIPQISGLANGVHAFNISVLNPNSVADPVMGNNYSNQPFSITNGYTIAAAGTSTICSGSTVTLTASGGATSYTWNPGAVVGTTAAVTPASTTIYSVSGTLATCVKIATVQITVNLTPTLVANSTTICVGGTATLIASGAPTYSWSTTQTTSSIMVSPGVNTTYTAYGINGTCISTKIVSVTIGTSLGIVPVANFTSYCNGGSTTITASGASTYTWQPGNLNGSSISVNPSTSTTYTVSGTAAACTGTNSILITVNPNPTVIATAANPTYCIPGAGTTLNGIGANTYTWQPGNLTGASVGINPATSTNYTVVGESAAGCFNTQNVFVTVNAKPTVNVASSSATLCNGEIGTLFAVGATSYVWNPGNLSGATVTISPTSTTTYSVTGTSNGCSSVQTIAITVFPCVGLITNSASNFQLSVYPNPFKDELNFNSNEEMKISIYNAIGQLMKSETISRTGSISTSDLPNAVYFVQVKGANETRVMKVVKH